MSDAKNIRLASGLSQVVVAVRGNVSPPTVRAYELDPRAVSATKRGQLDAVYGELAAELANQNKATDAA